MGPTSGTRATRTPVDRRRDSYSAPHTAASPSDSDHLSPGDDGSDNIPGALRSRALDPPDSHRRPCGLMAERSGGRSTHREAGRHACVIDNIQRLGVPASPGRRPRPTARRAAPESKIHSRFLKSRVPRRRDQPNSRKPSRSRTHASGPPPNHALASAARRPITHSHRRPAGRTTPRAGGPTPVGRAAGSPLRCRDRARRTDQAVRLRLYRALAQRKQPTVMTAHQTTAMSPLAPIPVPSSRPRRVSMTGVKGW